MPRWLRITLITLAGLAAVVAVTLWVLSAPRPEGTPGPEADALARAMAAAVGGDAWAKTGAISWNFGDRHRLLWDRERRLVRVQWADTRVLRRVGSTRDAVAYRNGRRLEGGAHDDAVEQAYAHWANDSFWLNPLEKLFDEGVTRELWHGPGGERGLIVYYASGGVTPGDTYLWLVDEGARPTAWRLWVKIIPIGGIEASWDDWETLSTGALVSTRHRFELLFGRELLITDVFAAETLEALTGGVDPFAEMFVGAGPPTLNDRRPPHQK